MGLTAIFANYLSTYRLYLGRAFICYLIILRTACCLLLFVIEQGDEINLEKEEKPEEYEFFLAILGQQKTL